MSFPLSRHRLTSVLATLLFSLACPPLFAGLENPWEKVAGPAPGKPSAIGSYSAGCVTGAVSLIDDEGSFQLMRKSRGRYYAQPAMRDLVLRLAGEVERRKWGRLLVGDLGQARGGPTTTGHASHQIGLDADFWFWLDSAAVERRLTPEEEEELSAISMLNEGQTAVDTERFGEKQRELLKLAATQPGVARIFVNPVIKRALCEADPNADWLRRVRPWWGHHYHFHVRLDCPPGQPSCESQDPPAADSGCGADLAWWFSEEAAAKAAAPDGRTPEQKLAARLTKVPRQCETLLH